MFIVNINDLPQDNFYICDKYVAVQLLKHNITPISILNGKYYFNKSKVLLDIINKGGEETE